MTTTAPRSTTSDLDQRPLDFELPDDDQALINALERRKEKGERARPDGQARTNIAYVLGHQWVVWNEDRKKFERAADRVGTSSPLVRITVNKVGPSVEHSVARITKQSPSPSCRPMSNDPDDVQAAEVGDRILASEFYRLDFQTKATELYFWVEPVGWAYLHVYWDPDQGEDSGLEVPEPDGEEDPDAPFLQSLMMRLSEKTRSTPGAPVTMPRGELCIDVVPHFELVVNPGAKTMKDARWCIRSVAMTVEDVWEKYDVKVAPSKAERSFADEIRTLTSVAGRPKEGGTNAEDQVMVHTFWCRPGTNLAPEGAVFTWTGKTVLEARKPWPFDHLKRLPFVQFNFLPGYGTREGRTWVGDLLPMQADYNDAVSRIATYRRQLSPKILAPRGSVDKRQWGSKLDVIDYRQVGEKPELWSPTGSWMEPHIQSAVMRAQEIGERAGVQDVSQGDAPSGMAAAAIMALQEADETKLAIPAKYAADGIAETGWMALMLIRQFWDEERQVRTFSEDNRVEVRHFQGSDIADEIDVYISSESLLSRSKSAQIAFAQFVLEHGLVQDVKGFMRSFTLPGMDAFHDHLNTWAQQARRENDTMALDAMFIEPAAWHNHADHIDEHSRFMSTKMWEELPEEQKAMFLMHLQHHYMYVNPALAAAIVPQQGMGAGQAYQAAGGGMSTPPGVDPVTGTTPDPLQVAAGQQPGVPTSGGTSPGSMISRAAGIGQAGRPGHVPGVSPETQSKRMGE